MLTAAQHSRILLVSTRRTQSHAHLHIQVRDDEGIAGDAGAGLVGIDGGVVSGVINLESSGVEAPDWRPRHDEHYHEA